jgi:hypothetical protein
MADFPISSFFLAGKAQKLMNSSDLSTSWLKSQENPKRVWNLYCVLTIDPPYVIINKWAAYKLSFVF